MSVVLSEEGLRKFIQKSLIKEQGLFSSARSDSGEGSVRYDKCDLSQLKNTVAGRKFVKYFLLKPEFTSILNGEKKRFTKNMLSIMISGGLSDTEDADYERRVSNYIQQNPDIIDNWISLLEITLTELGGPMMKMYCRLISTLFLPEKMQTPESEIDSDEADTSKIEKKISDAFEAAGNKYVTREALMMIASQPGIDAKHTILFPQTFKMIGASDVPGAQRKYPNELRAISFMIGQEMTPDSFYKEMSSVVFRGYSYKTDVLRPFDNLRSQIENTKTNGELIKRHLGKLVNEIGPVLNTTYNIS